MSIYKPTWLYIKQHNQTGLKYFGKTIRDPFKYKGSGKRWTSHLKKHGNNISTIWCQLFIDKETLVEYALNFSKENNIVNSKEWANLVTEDGIWGAGCAVGYKRTIENRHNISLGQQKRIFGPQTPEANHKRSVALKGRPQTAESNLKRSISLKGKRKSDAHRKANSESRKGIKRGPYKKISADV